MINNLQTLGPILWIFEEPGLAAGVRAKLAGASFQPGADRLLGSETAKVETLTTCVSS